MTASLPRVSIVIPAYNSGKFLREAIDSALAQSYTNCEVVVIDDGSTDESPLLIASYGDRIKAFRQPNGGLSAARNAGIRVSSGAFIAFLDADDIWSADKIARQVESLRTSPTAMLSHTLATKWVVEKDTRELLALNARKYQGRCVDALIDGNLVCVSSVMLKREVLNEVGMFDEKIRRPTTQDYDLWMRIARKHPLAFVDLPLVTYRVYGGNASSNRKEMIEDEIYVLKKWLTPDFQWSKKEVIRIKDRLSDLSLRLAFTALSDGRVREAHYWFGVASSADWRRSKAGIYWLMTLAPTSVIQFLRSLRRYIVGGVESRTASS